MIVQVRFVGLLGIHAESIAVLVDRFLRFGILEFRRTRKIINETKDTTKSARAHTLAPVQMNVIIVSNTLSHGGTLLFCQADVFAERTARHFSIHLNLNNARVA